MNSSTNSPATLVVLSSSQLRSWQPWLLHIQKFQTDGCASRVQQVQLVLNALNFLGMCG